MKKNIQILYLVLFSAFVVMGVITGINFFSELFNLFGAIVCGFTISYWGGFLIWIVYSVVKNGIDVIDYDEPEREFWGLKKKDGVIPEPNEGGEYCHWNSTKCAFPKDSFLHLACEDCSYFHADH